MQLWFGFAKRQRLEKDYDVRTYSQFLTFFFGSSDGFCYDLREGGHDRFAVLPIPAMLRAQHT